MDHGYQDTLATNNKAVVDTTLQAAGKKSLLHQAATTHCGNTFTTPPRLKVVEDFISVTGAIHHKAILEELP